MFGVALGPVVGRVIDSLVPWYASLISVLFLVCFQSIQVAAGGTSIAAVIIATFGLDVFRQMLQVSLSTSVFRYECHECAKRPFLHISLASLRPPVHD